MNGLISNVHFMLTSLYFFGRKENETWEKEVLINSMDDSTDVVVAIEEFTNINKDNAVSALDDFVDEENEYCDQLFWSKSPLCVLFLERFVWNENEDEMNVSPLGVL